MCNAPGELLLIDTPTSADKNGHIRVKIGHIGICGTDYHIYGGQQPFLNYPRVMGHELSGRAVKAASTGRFAAGDLVVVNPYLACGSCHACTLGKPNCCENIAVLGVHTDGGMCREVVVPEGNLIAAKGLSDKAAAMVEFLAIGAHGVRRARIAKKSSVLVVGAVPVEKLATHETSFADTVTNLPLWAKDSETLIKALIVV